MCRREKHPQIYIFSYVYALYVYLNVQGVYIYKIMYYMFIYLRLSVSILVLIH